MFLVSVGQVYWILGLRVVLLVGVRSSLLNPQTQGYVFGKYRSSYWILRPRVIMLLVGVLSSLLDPRT